MRNGFVRLRSILTVQAPVRFRPLLGVEQKKSGEKRTLGPQVIGLALKLQQAQ